MGLPFPGKKIRASARIVFFLHRGPGDPILFGAQGPPNNQGHRARSLSGGPGGLCSPGKILNYAILQENTRIAKYSRKPVNLTGNRVTGIG